MKGKFISFEGIDGAGKSSQHAWAVEHLRGKGIEVVATREPGGTALGEKLRALLLAEPMHLETEALLMFAARREHIAQVIAPALARGAWVLSDRFTDASFAYQGGGRGLSLDKLRQLELWVQGGAFSSAYKGGGRGLLDSAEKVGAINPAYKERGGLLSSAMQNGAGSSTRKGESRGLLGSVILSEGDSAQHGELQPDLTFIFDLPVAQAQQRRNGTGTAPDRFEQEQLDFHERVRAAYLARAREFPQRIHVLDARLGQAEINRLVEDDLAALV